ncbi:MAG: S-layer homology domain-containing protein [Clostridia bacterium]|nr:S-layer homology domain-containing protein [Clostridia bacterium]
MKKIISFILVLATVLSCFAVAVSAAPQGNRRSDEGMLPFEDVKSDHWFAPYLEFCYANGIIKGMNEYTFGHAGQLTRAQFVTMLANLEGVDTSAYSVAKFTDVKSNHWYYGAVAWAYEKGIVSGMTDTTFAPNGVLTRAQLAVVMRNYMQNKYLVEVKDDVLNKFSDKPKAEYWYYDAMKYAVSAGLISGMSNGTLSATGVVTRAQAVVIFESFVKKYFHGLCGHSFTAADCTNSSTCTICGMKQGLPKGHLVTTYDCVSTTTCLECGATVQPTKIHHVFNDATCTAARTCRVCGITRGEAKGHKWSAATCTKPKTCTVCNATEGGVKGHNWKAATCHAPKTCVVCNAKEGSALGHNYSGNYCTRCGAATPRAQVIYAMKTKASYSSSDNAYIYSITADSSTVGVIYDATSGELGLFYNGPTYGGGSDFTWLVLPVSGTTCRFEYEYYTSSGKSIFDGYGYIEAKTFNENSTVSFYSYNTSANNPEVACSNASGELDIMLTYGDLMFKELCGVSIADLGFNYYK